ncbi:hypothetical protein [Cryobacterium sp. PAMC25264]|uniref:hypothetical protein n=1 Tax=Cryobacterium sp. PAMC25264 TaxID=2861288 RepID=UPI001C631EB7|nr:hypothetical protein [Cryobacterium sp. PAMC25264]QYF72129.1 hypothetical protein KY500_09560 [Cryobacterium sp. PAMC25264]
MSLLDGRRSVLFVHAHPDDETISTGALIAEYVARAAGSSCSPARAANAARSSPGR